MLVVLAVALWLAGSLGLLHRTLHVPGLASATIEFALSPAEHAGAHAHPHAHARAQAHAHPHGIASLFGLHTDAECRLYDQLSHGAGALGVPLVVLPMTLPTATFAWLQGEAVARWVALFDARGPPPTR